MSYFCQNLKKLADKYTQKHIANCTGFSQSSINNYLSKASEPSIQFLIALKNAFGICIDEFLFSEIKLNENVSQNRFVGNYVVYYYNNNSYKGEVHTNLSNTLNYGVISVLKQKDMDKTSVVYGTFFKNKLEASDLLKEINKIEDEQALIEKYKEINNVYVGEINSTEQSIFINLSNSGNGDQAYMIFNNPPTYSDYIGGAGTINTIARGREHNPCVQYIIISKKLIDMPDGEIYECLRFNDYNVNLDYAIKEIIDLFKRLYVEKNEISANLTDGQKVAIVQNKLEYHFNEILDANAFRFAKISNREDDIIYKLIKEGIDVSANW